MNKYFKSLLIIGLLATIVNADNSNLNLSRGYKNHKTETLWSKISSFFSDTHKKKYKQRVVYIMMKNGIKYQWTRTGWKKISPSSSLLKNKQDNTIVKIAKTQLGSKYVWGATGDKGTFDCSGLTQYVYKQRGITIPRTSRVQSKYGKYIPRNSLNAGDLIFFDTSKKHKGYVNHVGIYIGNNQFLHASSAKKKVVISKLNKTFYGKRFKVARRPQYYASK